MGLGSSKTSTGVHPLLREQFLRHKRSGSESARMRRAVVLGATGATGKHLVYQLLKSPEWEKVTIVHRRELDIDGLIKEMNEYDTFSNESTCSLSEFERNKLKQHILDDMREDLQNHSLTQPIFRDNDVTFSVIGTTRKPFSDADDYVAIDYDLPLFAAQASLHAKVPHFSLLTSKASNPNIPSVLANRLWWHHPFFYLRLKGELERDVISLGFQRTSIFRPGGLIRPGTDRSAEKALISKGGTHVRDLAKVMIIDAETTPLKKISGGRSSSNKKEPPMFYEKSDIDGIAARDDLIF